MFNFKKNKSKPQDQRSGGNTNDPNADFQDFSVDSPSQAPGNQPRNFSPPNSGPRNITDTQVWQKSSAGIKGALSNYRNILKTAFKKMPRAMQEQLITRISMIVTLGVTIILVLSFYGFIPSLIRLVLVPIALVGAYFLGTRLVAPVILTRLDASLNEE